MHGLGTLIRLRLRRDRLTLGCWAVGLALLWTASGAGIGVALGEHDRTGLVMLLAANPALLMLRGAPTGTSVAAVLFVSVAAYMGLLVGMMSTFFAVRHTRAEEQSGRTELVGAGRVGRGVPIIATILVGGIEAAIVSLAVTLGSVAIGLDVGGSMAFGAGLWLTAIVFVGVGLITSAALPTSRGANGVAALVVAAAFIVRGVGDALGTVSSSLTQVESAWESWLSPIGWLTLIRPFAEPPMATSGWPLALLAGLAVVVLGVAVATDHQRELGTSLVGERPGPVKGAHWLGTPLGLAVRLHRGAVLGWAVPAFVVGALIGQLAPRLATQLGDNADLLRIVQSIGGSGEGASIESTFVMAFASIVVVIACVAALQVVVRSFGEEQTRGELAFSTRTSRSAAMASTAFVGAVSGAVVLGAFALATGTSFWVGGVIDGTTSTRWGEVRDLVVAFMPAIAVYLSLGLLLWAVMPRTLAWLSWLLLLVPMLGGEFSALFGKDWEWVHNFSPFHWLVNPLEIDQDWGPTWTMLGIAAAMTVVAFVWFRWRDLVFD